MSAQIPIVSASAQGAPASLAAQVRDGAGRCVACGLCLPHCPTYADTRSELESPRGRLSLMLALANNQLAATPALESHLSLCLMCRRCEAVCPAQVPFGQAMDAARAMIAVTKRAPWHRRVLTGVIASLTKPLVLGVARTALGLYQRSGMQTLLRRYGLLRRIGLARADAMLRPVPPHATLHAVYPAHGKRRGTVSLFTGCVARLLDASTLHDAVYVLTHLGYEVRVPPAQGCCGALHRHAGDAKAALAMQHRNIAAFADCAEEPILVTASGCAATLVEYDGDDASRNFAVRAVDISAWLNDIAWPKDLSLPPLTERVALHTPCTLANVLHAQQAPRDLLQCISGIKLVDMRDNTSCCGAAGAYHLDHPEMADALRQKKIDELTRLQPDILATSNVGCALFLEAGAREAGLDLECIHPVSLLARQMRASDQP